MRGRAIPDTLEREREGESESGIWGIKERRGREREGEEFIV